MDDPALAPAAPEVLAIPVYADNYVWLFRTPAGDAVAVDPGEAAPVAAELDRLGLRLGHILLTHHHWDHVEGTDDLRRRYGATVIGAAHDANRLPRLDRVVTPGEPFDLGGLSVDVLSVPGHTSGHVAYVIGAALFAGDTLFSFGCGRMFEGTAAEMWQSLVTLRELPAGTALYCGHEYTANNLRFACHLEPDNRELAQVAEEVAALRAAGRPTLPAPLDRERRLNPFLRCDELAFVQTLGLLDRSPAEVFHAIRARKDDF